MNVSLHIAKIVFSYIIFHYQIGALVYSFCAGGKSCLCFDLFWNSCMQKLVCYIDLGFLVGSGRSGKLKSIILT